MREEETLTEDNFLLYAASAYSNPSCISSEEFLDDVKRFKYLKKLMTKYQRDGVLKERLILNHIIVLNNVFGAECLSRMLTLKLGQSLSVIKPFLLAIDAMPQEVRGVGVAGSVVYMDDVPMDDCAVEAVRSLRDVWGRRGY